MAYGTRLFGARRVAAVLTSLALTLAVWATPAYAATTLPAAYKLTIFGGNGGGGAPIAGPAAASPLGSAIAGMAVDHAGNLIVADGGYIVKVTPGGSLTLIAGNGTSWKAPVPGPATASPLTPGGIAVDASDDVFVADYTGRILKITPAGTLSVIAGSGNTLSAPKPGPGLASPMLPVAVALDRNGNVLIADQNDQVGYQWGQILKLTPTGTLSVFAGIGDPHGTPRPGRATSSPLSPRSVAVDPAGNVYIADDAGYVLKVVPAGDLSIFAGDGIEGAPTAGPATSSHCWALSVATDSAGNVYVTTDDGYVSRISPGGVLLPIAGDGNDRGAGPRVGPATLSPMSPDAAVPGPSGRVYVGDSLAYVYALIPATRPGAVDPAAAARSASAVVTWPAPTDNGGAVIGEYKVQSSGDGGATWSGSTYVTSTRATIGGLTPGHGYQFRVAAVNVVGQGPWSQTLATVTPYLVAFTGYVHGCVCVHQTAWVGASAPSGSTISYAWKHGSAWISWNHPSLGFPMAWLGEQIEAKVQVRTPDGVTWTRYLGGGVVRLS